MQSIADLAALQESLTQMNENPVVPEAFLPYLSPFSWVGGENAQPPAAVERLAKYWRAAEVPLASSGRGFKVADVHTTTTELNTVLEQLHIVVTGSLEDFVHARAFLVSAMGESSVSPMPNGVPL